MNTPECREKFLSLFFALCEEHGFYIDDSRSPDYLRLFVIHQYNKEDKRSFDEAREALLSDAGL